MSRSHRSSHFVALSALVISTFGMTCSCRSKSATPAAPASAPLAVGSPWPKFRANAQQDGTSAQHATVTNVKPWSFLTGKGVFSSPIIAADGTIYIGSADRYFYAINPDGTLRWKILTGEIIDSSGLLDDQGRVYFGSGDGKLRALDAATGNAVWTMSADPTTTTGAFINWFEGNVAIGPTGQLYVPNDGFQIYGVDRAMGSVTWRIKMPDQTWSLPAVDVTTGALFVGNNNEVSFLGQNLFSFGANTVDLWDSFSPGTVAASPMLTPDGSVVVGGFDGYTRSYDAKSGTLHWQTPARDHIYASPAKLADGTIIQPSADGTLYALNPVSGSIVWTFDTREPIRSSPAVDADGNIYFGSGEGKLYVVKPDGTLRFSMQLISDPRNDLNASPALGQNAVYLAGESGEVFSIPYDYCLRSDGAADPRCMPDGQAPLPSDGALLLPVTAFGKLLSTAPATIDRNQPLGFQVVVRVAGRTQLAVLDSTSVKVTVTPPTSVITEVAGDGKFLLVTPTTVFPAGPISIAVSANYLVNLQRSGLALSGGTVGGNASTTFASTVNASVANAFALPIPQNAGDPSGVWEMSRLALPLPTLLPSYNQIGFDSLHYLVGMVEGSGGHGVAWMTGAKLASDENRTIVDPSTKALFPLALDYEGGDLTLANQNGLRVEVMNATIPFRSFRVAAPLDSGGNSTGAHVTGSTVCAQVPLYGLFLEKLGLCNPQTDVLTVYGAANFNPWQSGTQAAPAGLGTVALTANATSATATLTGSSLKLADHVYAVLLVDASSGNPVTLDYGLSTTRVADNTGTITSVTIPFGGQPVPSTVRAYLMVDTYPAARATITIK